MLFRSGGDRVAPSPPLPRAFRARWALRAFNHTCLLYTSLAPELPFEAGAMAEPLACCLHGIDAAGIRPGSTVCVSGGGAIGLLMVQLARLSGAAKVIPVSYTPLPGGTGGPGWAYQ